VVEGDLGDAEGAETMGSSHGDLGLVVEALDDAAREHFLGVEIIEDQFAVPAEGSGDFFIGSMNP
jgi:hypothetical protein